MPESIITYFGKKVKARCDGNCCKAWGVAARPKKQLSDDVDDIFFYADGELGIAPADPGTYEGGHGKPASTSDFPNKWCLRQCERCGMSKAGESALPMEIKDWSVRVFNQPWKHQAN